MRGRVGVVVAGAGAGAGGDGGWGARIRQSLPLLAGRGGGRGGTCLGRGDAA